MGLLDSWRGRSIGLTDTGFWTNFFGRRSEAGVSINDNKALQLSAFWSCLRVTSQAVASMPLVAYSSDAKGNRTELDDKISEVVRYSPNAEQTPFEFWQGQIAWLLARGNAFAEKRVNSKGELIALLPMRADHVDVRRNKDTDDLEYVFTDRGKSDVLPAKKIFHLRNFSLDGACGESVVHHGVQSLGMAFAADQSAAKLFANGLQMSGILTSEQTLKADQRDKLQNVMSEFMGSKNAHKLMILEAGLKYAGVTLNPGEAQLLETRRFNIEEICRWFNIPPILIGHAAQGQTMWGSGVEQIMLGWLTTGLNPLIRNIEARMRKDLLPTEVRKDRFFKFNREGLLEADSAAKAAFLSSMVQNGLMTRNEARSKLDLPEIDGGNVITAQTNLAPLDKLGQNDVNDTVKNAFRDWMNDGTTSHEED